MSDLPPIFSITALVEASLARTWYCKKTYCKDERKELLFVGNYRRSGFRDGEHVFNSP